ncbi:Protein CBG27582 [Caenorhabditis briggsae]|uniref:Protein CBG27582 n=1 Tax=Caenorhabditis briggsae TaxID=6238 RepID=B6IKF2_CAEBR|nr:Protein CBG27582 [Caenorhabditis briggsae]CAS00382.1 Protein CBG27582 [Caenorhabditis briggsae]
MHNPSEKLYLIGTSLPSQTSLPSSLTCNELKIGVRSPLDLLPIIGNLSSENFERLTITSEGYGVFEMEDVVDLPQ